MVWWRNRDEGFEWKTYVRTTILVRRGERRRKVEGIRHAAVDGLKMAGQRGVEAGLAGTAAAGSGTWSALKWIAAAPGRAWQAISPQLIPPLTRLRLRLAEALAPAIEVLLRPVIYVSVAIVGWVFGIGGLLRLMRTGLDDETVASVLIAAAALVLTAGVRLLSGEASPLFKSAAGRALSDRLRAVAASRGGVLAMAAALVLGGAGLWVLMNPATTQPSVRSDPSDRGISGRATALTGDSLQIGATTVRLAGIEAPDPGQTCQRANAKTWSCGSAARAALDKIVRGRRVRCDGDEAAAGIVQTSCTINDQDIAARLVRDGNVFAEQGWRSPYGALEAQAREAKSGLWAGEAEHPHDWRTRMWEEAKRDAPQGCPIKGRITSGNRVYVLPGSASYERVKVRETRGERWFCSEDEAQAAGWKASRTY